MTALHPMAARLQAQVMNLLRRNAILRARSYKRVFSLASLIGRDVEIVLADLRDHCFATKTTFHVDPYEAGRRQGRREAWLRIAQHLYLDEEKVQKLVELEDE
jgi:hypothetical protein